MYVAVRKAGLASVNTHRELGQKSAIPALYGFQKLTFPIFTP